MSLFVTRVVGLASVQGLPSLKLVRYGVPPGGAVLQTVLQRLNRCLGNSNSAAAIEVAQGWIELIAESSLLIAVSGSPATLKVNGAEVPGDRLVEVEVGSRIEFGMVRGGNFALLGIRGGLATPPITTPIGSGERLFVAGLIDTEPSPIGEHLPQVEEALMAQIAGYWDHYRNIFVEQPVTFVIESMSRKGIRLSGPLVEVDMLMTSEPISPGTIQAAGPGNYLVIGPDGPTMGGYFKFGYLHKKSIEALFNYPLNSPIRVLFS
ncbi:MAG: hypothetical protein JST40_13450 [Armatimonadetes bacterium]|nr:hypothetical protein [Armatimonadota bacterium]